MKNNSLTKEILPWFRFFGNPKKFWLTAYIFWAIVGLAVWQFTPITLKPTPLGVLKALNALMNDGLIEDIFMSTKVMFISSFLIAFPLGCLLAYLAEIPALSIPIKFLALLRSMGTSGLATSLIIAGFVGTTLKVTILSFSMTVFFLSTLLDLLALTPPDQINHGITMGMTRWQIMWHRIIRGKMDLVLLYFIPNIAIVWNMISFVEGLARNQGGLGDRQLVAERFISFDTVWAIALVTLTIGLFTAFSVFAVRWIFFPYTRKQETRKE